MLSGMRRNPAAHGLLGETLGPLLERLPARAVVRAGLGRCLGCAMAPFETVEEAARILRRDPAKVAHALEVARGR